MLITAEVLSQLEMPRSLQEKLKDTKVKSYRPEQAKRKSKPPFDKLFSAANSFPKAVKGSVCKVEVANALSAFGTEVCTLAILTFNDRLVTQHIADQKKSLKNLRILCNATDIDSAQISQFFSSWRSVLSRFDIIKETLNKVPADAREHQYALLLQIGKTLQGIAFALGGPLVEV